MTSHPLYSWQHTHSIWHHIPYTCDITATVSMRRQLLCLWHHTQYIWHLTGCMNAIQPRYLTSYSQYLCNHTQLIDDITPYVCMKSQPLHIGHHRHYLRHHILSWWHHTTVCMSRHTLCLWHHIHYIWCHTHCVYDNTTLYLTWNPFYLPSHPLYMSPHPLCQRHHTNYVRHHTWLIYAIMCTIHDTISTL